MEKEEFQEALKIHLAEIARLFKEYSTIPEDDVLTMAVFTDGRYQAWNAYWLYPAGAGVNVHNIRREVQDADS